ncbi:MAG: CotH kinase family protein, partial [Bacillota bacterium]
MSHAVGGTPQYRKSNRRRERQPAHLASLAEPLEPRWLLAADLVISEFMASNSKTLKDSEGDYSDWIEINNRGDASIDLNGWYLTDKSSELTEWRLPQRVLAPGEYLLVFASGKDMITAGGELHTSFRLEASGEYLALVRPDGTTVQFEYAPRFPAQSSDVSFGLAPDSDERVYFTKPTPQAANQLSASEPVFSQPGRTFFGSLTVSLSTSSPGAQIRYTLDQSTPTATSLLYTGPITLTKTTTVRARVFVSGIAPGPIASQCYFALDTNAKSFRSNLPVVVIDSFGRSLGDTSLTPVAAAFIETGADGYADITDRVDFAGRGGFRLRGQSSQGFPKVPYALETWDESNHDRSVSILGMPAESDWILYNPYSEKSLMQNYLAYMWSNRMGDYAVRTRYVEVFVNTDGGSKISYSSDYVGIYILMEKIKVDENRVDIAPLTPSDNVEPDITGGYIFKKDKFDAGERGFTTSTGQVFLYADPGETELTAQQKAYLTGYINSFEKALYGVNFKDPLEGYAKYIDVDSWIDAHIMVEMTKNIDGFRLSTYWYKDRGGKIKMGPIWDYNLSMGNADYYSGSSAIGWYYSQLSDYDYPYWRRLFQDPDFQQRWIDRWQELRRDAFSTNRIMADIDALVQLLSDGNGNYPVGAYPTQPANNPVVRNFKRWNVLGTYLWPNGYVGRGWMDDVNWMKNFLKTRLAWIDSQYLAAPVLNQDAGTISSPFKLTLSSSGKPIYYTLDGSDPRLPGGAINPKARLYNG